MKLLTLGFAVVTAALPFSAQAIATDFVPSKEHLNIQYGNDLSIALQSTISNSLFETVLFDENGILHFGMLPDLQKVDAILPVSLKLNTDTTRESFSAIHDNQALAFVERDYDFAPAFNTTFADFSDTKVFKMIGGAQTGDQFHTDMLSTLAIPLPASVILLIGALAGLGWLGQQRDAA